MARRLVQFVVLLVLLIAPAATRAQDPALLDEVIGRWQKHIASLEDQLAEAERLYAETRNGRIYLLVLPIMEDSYQNVMMTLTKTEFLGHDHASCC